MIGLAQFWEGAGRQLSCPIGRWGRLTGRLMAVVNRQPNRLAIEALRVAPTDTVLELGFGPGAGIKALSALASRGLVLGIDRSPEMVAQASRANRRPIREGRVRLMQGCFASLPWQAETVDKILAVNTVYFFGPQGAEVREAWRVLRPGGVMAIYATHRSTMQRWKFSGPNTHRLVDVDELHALAISGGFGSADLDIHSLTLPYGIHGMIATMRKHAVGD
jgi:SAM-dependent methyltransferase